MLSYGILALCIVVTLMIGLWTFAIRLQGGRASTHASDAADSEIDLSPSDTNGPATPGVDCESPPSPCTRTNSIVARPGWSGVW